MAIIAEKKELEPAPAKQSMQWLKWAGFGLLAIVVAVQIYRGMMVKKVGVPGLFEIEFVEQSRVEKVEKVEKATTDKQTAQQVKKGASGLRYDGIYRDNHVMLEDGKLIELMYVLRFWPDKTVKFALMKRDNDILKSIMSNKNAVKSGSVSKFRLIGEELHLPIKRRGNADLDSKIKIFSDKVELRWWSEELGFERTKVLRFVPVEFSEPG